MPVIKRAFILLVRQQIKRNRNPIKKTSSINFSIFLQS
jgi:hypothetical protein